MCRMLSLLLGLTSHRYVLLLLLLVHHKWMVVRRTRRRRRQQLLATVVSKSEGWLRQLFLFGPGAAMASRRTTQSNPQQAIKASLQFVKDIGNAVCHFVEFFQMGSQFGRIQDNFLFVIIAVAVVVGVGVGASIRRRVWFFFVHDPRRLTRRMRSRMVTTTTITR